MKTTTTLAAALLSALACQAQDAPAERPPRPPMPILEALDTDEDGTLSAGEIAGAAESLRTLDLDGDGTLSKDELRPKPPEGAGEPPAQNEGNGPARRPRRPVPPLLMALDGDRDRELSAEEIDAAPESLAKLDKDGDGELTARELHPRRPRAEGDEQAPPPGGRRPGEGGPPRDR